MGTTSGAGLLTANRSAAAQTSAWVSPNDATPSQAGMIVSYAGLDNGPLPSTFVVTVGLPSAAVTKSLLIRAVIGFRS